MRLGVAVFPWEAATLPNRSSGWTPMTSKLASSLTLKKGFLELKRLRKKVETLERSVAKKAVKRKRPLK
jgi:hypothetical protein